MTPGPTIVRQCAKCAGLIFQRTIISGNTCGATFWTDGKREAPMMPDRPRLVGCPHCRALVWINELTELGQIRMGAGPGAFAKGSDYVMPSLEDYLLLLAQGVPNAARMMYVRFRTWWVGNDQRRVAPEGKPLSDGERSNLEALVALLDEKDDNQRLSKAEVLRELGRFEEALALLAQPLNEGFARAVTLIRSLAEKADPYVRELRFDK